VDKLSYHLHDVHRGDIVVFARPPLEDQQYADLVKRVIGLPGDTVSLEAGQVYINGKLYPEPFLPAAVQQETDPGPSGEPYALGHPFKVPAGDVFVMGDNRPESCDSRYWGSIPTSTIVGQVDLRIWPVTRLHLF
jgi:signal peptidase I